MHQREHLKSNIQPYGRLASYQVLKNKDKRAVFLLKLSTVLRNQLRVPGPGVVVVYYCSCCELNSVNSKVLCQKSTRLFCIDLKLLINDKEYRSQA